MPDDARALCRMVLDTLGQPALSRQAAALRQALDGATDGETTDRRAGSPAPPFAVADRYYEDALATARAGRAVDLAESLATMGQRLRWTQTDSYVSTPPHDHFLERYAHATILGSRPDSAVLVDRSCTAAVGVLLLGPGNWYPHHQHPADEVYLPLTHALWSSGAAEPYVDLPPGTALHHEPLQPHAVRTSDHPLLAVYLWTGDTTASGWWCAGP